MAGPVGAMVYRAINTLDSMFGHQDERYRRFGWAAARIDDLANYLPARLDRAADLPGGAAAAAAAGAGAGEPCSATAETTPAPTPALPRRPWPGRWACSWAA